MSIKYQVEINEKKDNNNKQKERLEKYAEALKELSKNDKDKNK